MFFGATRRTRVRRFRLASDENEKKGARFSPASLKSRRLLVCTTPGGSREGTGAGTPERDLPEGNAGRGAREDALGVDHALVSVGDPRVAPARTRETRSRCSTFPVRPFRRRDQQRLMLVAARHGAHERTTVRRERHPERVVEKIDRFRSCVGAPRRTECGHGRTTSFRREMQTLVFARIRFHASSFSLVPVTPFHR